MTSIYIYPHLGMGDNILCNGLIRHISESYNKVYVFTKDIIAANVMFMYKDNPKIKIISMSGDYEILDFIKFNTLNTYLILGHTPEYFKGLNAKEYTFEEGFYKIAGVPFEYKWEKFYIERDLQKEKEAFELAGIKKGEPYIFVHDDPARGRNFRTEYITNKYKSIHPVNFQHINLFNFLSIIENAKEVHVHNSSFANIIDTMELKSDGVFYHKYARTDCGDQVWSKNLNWVFYE